MKNRRRASRLAWLPFLAPSMIGVLIFVVLPFFDVIRRSFMTAVTQQFHGFHNYKVIFENTAFQLAVQNTVRFTLVCIPLLVVSGFLTAMALSKMKHVQLLKALYLFPLAMPTATVVLIWKMMFYPQGFLNQLLTAFLQGTGMGGEVRVDYLGTDAAFFVLTGSYLWKNLGYTVVLWLAGILSISAAVLEAAKVDGAEPLKRLFYVILPQLKGSLYTIVILSFLNSFKIYREAYLVSGAYPQESIYLLQHLFNNWFVNLELDKMAAAAVLVGGVLFAVIMLLQGMWDKERN